MYRKKTPYIKMQVTTTENEDFPFFPQRGALQQMENNFSKFSIEEAFVDFSPKLIWVQARKQRKGAWLEQLSKISD